MGTFKHFLLLCCVSSCTARSDATVDHSVRLILSSNPCESLPCQNNANCVVYGGGLTNYACSCVDGFSGVHCEIPPKTTSTETPKTESLAAQICDKMPCMHNSTCTPANIEPYYRCQCHNQNAGYNCEHDNVCHVGYCHHGGSCLLTHGGSPYCTCTHGYQGNRCQHGPCHQQPCQNGGSCQHRSDVSLYYVCQCTRDFEGTHCEIARPTHATVTTTRKTTVAITTESPRLTTSSSSKTAAPQTTTVFKATTSQPTNPGKELYCLNCLDAISPSTCEEVIQCGQYGVCYLDELFTHSGSVRWNMGCRDILQCAGPMKRQVESYDVIGDVTEQKHERFMDYPICSECCNTSNCNINGCNQPGFPSRQSRGPICFACDQQRSPDDCSRIRTCSPSEVCMLQQKVSATTSDILWQSSCVDSQQCSTTKQHVVGKRSNHSANARAACTTMCCTDDLCNNRCE